jgi:PAS domain S-box-containing protein
MAKRRGRVVSFPSLKNAEEDILQVARNLSVTIGSEFFSAMARHLVRELGADCIYIGEFIGGRAERMKPLAAYLNGEPDYSAYPLAGSAAALSVVGKPCVCRTNAQKRFPEDQLLAKAKAAAFVMVPLPNSHGTAIGFMMVAYREAARDLDLVQALLEIFAPRASAELARQQKDEQLRESEQRYRAFIELNTDGLWRVEFEQPIPTDLPEQEQIDRIYQYGYIAECNSSLARLLGYTKPEQLVGSPIDLVVKRSNTSMEQALLTAIRSEYRFTTVETMPVDRHGKGRYMLRSQWGIVDRGMLLRLWGSTRDITELKLSERALSASEQRMSDLLESVHLMVVMLDPDGAVKFCNDYFWRLTGWKAEDLAGRAWLEEVIPAEDSARLKAAFRQAVEGSQAPLHFESSLAGPGEHRRWVSWDTAFLRGADDRVAAIVNIGRDITEQKTLETQVRQSQKLESIGRLASGIAHDFNNLLTIVIGYSDTLLRGKTAAHPEYLGLSEIRKSAERGTQLTHQLLAFSRRQHLRPEILNLNTLVSDMQRMLQRLIGGGIKLAIELDPLLGMVRADAGQMHQVLLNLALNARDAMPVGGQLTIATSNLDVQEARADSSSGAPPGVYVQLTVADTGVGMSEEVRNHLFEPFFTTKEPGKGTGLGLSTVYGIVRQSGGHIVVETVLQKGTSIRVFLPRVQGDLQTAAASRVDALPRGTETILVVEDQAEVRLLAVRMAESLGYTVLEAEHSARAMEILRERPEVQLILTDVMMPEIDGYVLVNMVRSIRPEIKVVYMSGYPGSPRTMQTLSDPEVVFLAKPFDAASLALTLRKALEAK